MAADKTITISGTVRDATETLIGASISYPSANGTPRGTVTDLDGNFTLNDVPSNATVTISFAGCTEQKYTASSIPSTITLNCENTLNELVVKACAPDKENGIAEHELIDDECYPTKCIEPRWKLSGSGKSAKCVEQKCTFDNGTGEWTQNNDTWECKLTSCNTDKGYKKSTDETQCEKMPQESTDEKLKEQPTPSDTGTETSKIDECEDGYRISSDGQKCEPSLDEKQARDKAKELRANADEMKRVEQSTENKLLGAAGMGAAGIGGMQVASALAEKNADEDAERDMAAYLATFRCDYGHGLNIKGGETGIELPGANSLIPLYQEYVNLANDLKVRKNALGMKPGIESEKILDAATSGLYDNQSIGKVDGAFTSLARALADPTGADAAEWAAQKDATAKKLKTGAVVAGIGILGSAVGNAIINRNVNEKSDEIKRKYENIVDIPKPTPLPTERKCSDFKGATGTYPECTCTDNTNYFAAEQGCVPCGTGQTFNPTTKKCECTDTNKQYNKTENKCTCKSPMVENASGVCTNPQPPVPDCELTGLVTKDCKCVNGAAQVGNNCECRSSWYSPDNKTCAECKSSEHKVVIDNQCVCQAPYYSTDGNKTCTECKASDNKEIKDGKCQCKEGYNPDSTTGKCERIPAPEPLIKISFGSDVLFETGSAKLANNGKTMLAEFNKRLEDAQKNSNNKFDLKTDTDYCISVTGHTDRTPFRGDQLKNAPTNPNNKNMKLSLQRANAVKDKLSEVANPANIWAQGLGENHCTAETYPARNDQRCRRVDIEFWTGSCESNKASATSGMLQSTVKGLADNVGDQLIKNITGDTKKKLTSDPTETPIASTDDENGKCNGKRWAPLDKYAALTRIYEDRGTGIHQPETRSQYSDYLGRAKSICESAGGTYKIDEQTLTEVKNVCGTYNKYDRIICDFGTPDTTPGSTRCQSTFKPKNINFTQGCSEGFDNYTCCLIFNPES